MIKEGSFSRKLKVVKWLNITLVIVLILLIVYMFLSFTDKCEDKNCFNEHLIICKRTTWINDAEEAIWKYTILSKYKDECKIKVELKSVKKGQAELESAEGSSMNCYLPLNVVLVPGQNLEYCTGPLKEKLQDLIIKKMHSYILENLGRINEELTNVV